MLHYRWTNHGPCLFLVHKIGARERALVLRLGWGYDADLPLRPWPAMHQMKTPRGRADTCVAWFGFYFGWTR